MCFTVCPTVAVVASPTLQRHSTASVASQPNHTSVLQSPRSDLKLVLVDLECQPVLISDDRHPIRNICTLTNATLQIPLRMACHYLTAILRSRWFQFPFKVQTSSPLHFCIRHRCRQTFECRHGAVCPSHGARQHRSTSLRSLSQPAPVHSCVSTSHRIFSPVCAFCPKRVFDSFKLPSLSV